MTQEPKGESVDDSGDGGALYRKLPLFAEARERELKNMLEPVVQLTDAYGELASRAILALGRTPSRDRQDIVVRDLLTDVFDFLYEWRRPLLEGRVHVGFPLGRRAYESLSLASAAYQDSGLAHRWDSGKQLGNHAIRKALSELPFKEDEDSLRDLYSFFSKGTHPNRDLVSERFLGDGNEYMLGSIGTPDLVMVVDSCIHLVELWFWSGALVGVVAREPLRVHDPYFGHDYLAVAADAPDLKAWLVGNFNRLLEEAQGRSLP